MLLRNSLVHHFIDEHDLWSLEGCRGAHKALLAAYSRIDQHFEQLRGWAEHMEQSRRLADAFVRSKEFRDLVINGIAPDGKVDWSAAGIVRALREAAKELAVDGGHLLRRLASGLPSGSRNSYLQNMDAAVGVRSCMNRALSRFVTLT